MNKRRVKFRGYQKTLNQWDYFTLQELHQHGQAGGTFEVYENIGQFIGFSDKHEKDIYEGDIVKIKNPKHDGYRVVLIEADEDTSSWPVWKMHKQFVEVIGNIFENPELLA